MDRNYEQEYNKAFEAAKGLHDAGNALTKKQMEIVFPQLAESEDERIRKALIWHLKADTDFVSNGVTKTECIAWLKKQKEPENTSASTMIPSCWEIEQKSAECSDDERIREDIIALIKFGLNDGSAVSPGSHTTKEEALAYLEKQKEQKPEEWSEEDRLHYANVLEALEYVKGCKSDYDKIEAVKSDIAWLKLLRNRVGKEFLQPHWKPSEEQMKALLGAEGISRASGYPDNAKVLASLYEELKKL